VTPALRCRLRPGKPHRRGVPESRRVLVVSDQKEQLPAGGLQGVRQHERTSTSPSTVGLRSRSFLRDKPSRRSSRPAGGFDTGCALAALQHRSAVCRKAFKKALRGLGGTGTQADFIQDSDDCGGASGPDYTFRAVPVPADEQPRRTGRAGATPCFFVEENTLGNAKEGDPAADCARSLERVEQQRDRRLEHIYKYDAKLVRAPLRHDER